MAPKRITVRGRECWQIRTDVGTPDQRKQIVRRFSTHAKAKAELARITRAKKEDARVAALPAGAPVAKFIKEVRRADGTAAWQLRKDVGSGEDRRQISRRFDTMAEAQEALAHLERTCDCTVELVLDEYLSTLTVSDTTRACYSSDLAPVRRALGSEAVGFLTPAVIFNFCADLANFTKISGPGKGELKSERSISLTRQRLLAALAGHIDPKRALTVRKPIRKESVVYVIGAEGTGLVKIGHAVDVAHRLQNLQSGSPVKLTLLGVFDGIDGRALERSLHVELAAARRHGEWFDLGPDPLAVVNALVA